MKYSCNDDQYRAFLCYRRKSTNPLFTPSEDVAGMLHWWLNYGPKLAKDGPALFEECYPQGGALTYGEEGIARFVPQMEMAFVVLCPGFFERTLDAFYDVLADHGGKTEQELLRIARERLSVQDRDVCFLEIQRILAAENCRVIPVLVKAGGRDACADLKNRDITWLKKILGQGSEVLFDTINSCTVDYDQLSSFMDGLCWAETDEQTARGRMKAVEASEEGAALLGCLKQMLHMSEAPVQKSSAVADTILADLKRCARTFLNLQQPAADDRYFYAGNPKLIFDPIRSCNMRKDVQIKPPFLAACLVESFRENQRAFGLQMDQFSYWNVNLSMVDVDPRQVQSIPLSVCAVCFGTLSVHHYLRKERSRLQEAPILDEATNPILKTIRSGQNLLLALRNPYTKTWPSTWEFNNKADESIGVEGTTNQTTLSLSTLMSCGFLAPDIPQKYLKARYDYIWESVDVLLDWGVSRISDRRVTGWRYTPESHNGTALLPTVFVFDTLCKLRQNILELIPVFSPEDPFRGRLEKDLQTVEQTLTEIIGFIAQKQCGRLSDAPGAFRRFAGTEYSATHTAYVIKSLYQYIQDHGQSEELDRILLPAIDYLLEKMDAMKLDGDMHFREWERYEDFCDSDPNDNDGDCLKSTFGEQYEHCAELIIGEALIKIAENIQDVTLAAKAKTILAWMFDKYLEEKRLVGIDGDTVRVRGVRSFLPFPIYALYYYRMFLWDYLQLLEKTEG